MKKSPQWISVMLLLVLLTSVVAAPSLLVTKRPVRTNSSFTGPTNDPHAIAGQWFRSVTNGNLESRACEFHDNTISNGGGYMGNLAISGRVTNVVQSLFNITAFEVDATIINDTPGLGVWASGTNSHGEASYAAIQQTGTLRQVILAAEFAISSQNNLPPYIGTTNPPYIDMTPWIIAVGHDYEAWYCWNPDKEGDLTDGNFFVPAWSFGDITPGTALTVRLSFVIPGDGLSPGNPRYDAIMDSWVNGTDILANRSLSLKISNWQNEIGLDDGTPYPTNTLSSGDVAVFHNLDFVQEESSAIVIHQLIRRTNTIVTVASVGDGWAGDQVLQYSPNLMETNWCDVATNTHPLPAPCTNYWEDDPGAVTQRFYRVLQR